MADAGFALSCRLREVPREGALETVGGKAASRSPSGVRALVCETRENAGVPLGSLGRRIRQLPFGRAAGFSASVHFPRYLPSGVDEPLAVAVASGG